MPLTKSDVFTTVGQRNFARGLDASTPDIVQPRGTVPRLSNFLLTRRGGLTLCDGSLVVSAYQGQVKPGIQGPWLDLMLYQPNQVTRYLLGLQLSHTVRFQLSDVSLGSITVEGVGGGQLGLPIALATWAPFTNFFGTTGSGFHSVVKPAGINNQFVCIQTGISGATEPNWASMNFFGGEISDGSVLWVNTYVPVVYSWVITVVDPAGGETPGTIFTPPNINAPNGPPANWIAGDQAVMSWGGVAGAASYNVYRTAAGGNFWQFVANSPFTNFTDNVPDGQLGQVHFTSTPNTTASTVLLKIPEGSYTDNNQLDVFPAATLPPLGWSIGQGSGSTGTGGAGAGVTANGGIIGAVGPVPQMLQFVDKVILCLGNGIPPWVYTDAAAVNPPILGGPLQNSFTSVYPDWIATTAFAAGDLIKPTQNNPGGYVFTVVQGGISGATTAQPVWSQTVSNRVVDASIIWQNTGVTPTIPAPRGAAHGLVYAGALWLANTYPTTTSDNLDGPTVLKMSDLNNPESWNPLNVAFIGRDDGTQVTGLAAYTVAETGIPPIGSMVVFKDFETYQIVGVFGALDFSIQKAQTDVGCVAPRSIQFLPGYGLARLTHLGVAIFDGVRDRLISEEIRPYLFGGVEDIIPIDWSFAYLSKGTQAATPPMYMLAIPIMVAEFPLPITLSPPTMSYNPNTPSLLNAATFWFVVTAVVDEQDVVRSNEISFSVPFTQPDKLFTLTATVNLAEIGAVPGVTAWRIYWGYASGLENQYVEVPYDGVTGSVTITGPSTPGIVGAKHNGLTRILCYDLVLKAWAIIDLPWPIEVLKQVRAISSPPVTLTGGFDDGTVRRVQAGDPDWDGLPIDATVRSPEVFGKFSNQSLYLRRLTIRGFVTGPPPGDFQNTFSLNLTVDGQPENLGRGRLYVRPNGRFELTLDLGFLGRTIHVDLGVVASRLNLPVEIHEFDWEVSPRIPGIPLSI